MLRLLGIGFVCAVLALGGGGTPAPLPELACEILAAFALFGWVALRGPESLPVNRRVWFVLLLIVAVPLLQLVPLPPSIWHELPGRSVMRDALALVGQDQTWRPLSVAPQRTLDGVLSLLPPFVAMLFVATMDARDRTLLLKVIAAFGLLSVAVGAAQLAGGGESPLQFYYRGQSGILFGFQGNRNAQADVLLIAIIALVVGWSSAAARSRAMLGAVLIVGAALLLGVILTASRTGVGLIPVAVLWCMIFLSRERLIAAMRVKRWQWLALAGAGVAGGIAAWQTNAIGRVLARFDFSGEYRPDIWRDAIFAIQQYWPLGSGLGTFTRVIPSAERLEAVRGTLNNRAHNEYLELLLEGGLPLAFCWSIVAALVLAGIWRGLRSRNEMPTGHAIFAAGTVSLTALHSLVDYPFRSMALVTLIAIAAALVLAPRPSEKPTSPRESTNL